MIISHFKMVYQARTNIVRNEKGDVVKDCNHIRSRWKNQSSQLFSEHRSSDVWQTEIHTAEALVSEPSVFDVEMAIEKIKRHKSPGINQIPAEIFKAGS